MTTSHRRPLLETGRLRSEPPTETFVPPVTSPELRASLELEQHRIELALTRLATDWGAGQEAIGQRRTHLLRALEEQVKAHLHAEEALLHAQSRPVRARVHYERIVRQSRDILERFEQLSLVPVDHPLWRCHLDELTRRLRAHLERERQRVHGEAFRARA
jgi:hypothetical protein